MNKLLSISLLSIALSSCKCAPQRTVPTETAPTTAVPTSSATPNLPPVQETEKLILGDGWQITFPPGWVDRQDVLNENDVKVKLLFNNQNKGGLFMLSVEETVSDFDTYNLLFIRDLKDHGVLIRNSTAVQVNGVHFILSETEREDVLAYVWVGVRANKGYRLSCGHKDLDLKNECFKIINSFKFNG